MYKLLEHDVTSLRLFFNKDAFIRQWLLEIPENDPQIIAKYKILKKLEQYFSDRFKADESLQNALSKIEEEREKLFENIARSGKMRSTAEDASSRNVTLFPLPLNLLS